MPSTWLRWGTDANGDGVADPWNPEDAIFSAARYLAAAGGARRLCTRRLRVQPRRLVRAGGARPREHVSGSDGSIAFTFDRLQQNLDAARRGRRRRERAPARRADASSKARTVSPSACTRVPSAPALLSDRLALEQRAGQADAACVPPTRVSSAPARRRSQPRAGQPRERAAGGKRRLAAGRHRAAPRRAELLGRLRLPGRRRPRRRLRLAHPPRLPGRRTSPRPRARPSYALADGVVVRAWTEPDPRCGIGFTYPRLRRPDLDVLPPRRSRPGRRSRRPPDRRDARRARRPHGRCDRSAPPPPAAAGDRLAAAGALVRGLRRPRLQLVGRRGRPRRDRLPDALLRPLGGTRSRLPAGSRPRLRRRSAARGADP